MKDKMKKILFLVLSLILLGGANSVKAIVLGDEITSLAGITDGTMFIISDDGTKAKYFWGNGTTSGENENKNANIGEIPADAYFYFSLEKYTGDDIPNTTSPADNIYRIKITNADGDGYPYGSNGCYLNAVLSFADVVISGPEAGWSNVGNEKKDALWYVTYDEEKGFSFRNVYRSENSSLSSWLAIGKNFESDQQYLKLYSKPVDPLATEKAALQAEINRGNNVNTFAKTAASVTALSDAISAGETELSNKAATAESLVAAKNAITTAIAGLKLQDGYTNLTKEMANANVDYVLNSSTGLAYGTNSVDMNTYAELNEFDQFVVLASAGKPRFCMNRLTANGQIGADQGSSNMIDINPQGDYAGYTWATTEYQTIDGNKYTLDLKKIAEDWNGLARLHAIKGANYNNVTVTDMLLYRTVTVGETGYATFGSLNKSAKLNGVTAYAAKYEGGVVTLAPVTNVPAGKGVVVKAGAGSFAPTFDVEASDIDSDLKVSDGTVTGDGSTIYVLNKVADTVGFYLLKAGNTLEAGKAYLKIDNPSGARSFVGIRGLDATGISTVQDSPKTDDVYYNLNGQRVSKIKKGLYIRNGKKAYVN